ncbi:MAG: ECF transporter S component [Clostridia bacterium]|nr:ECF transporter S component [Clostridia bacterium]
MTKKNILRLTYSALFLALALLLPFLTGQIPQIGQALSPMHIPVLLCGFLCGWYWGMAVGFVAPLLRYLLFGMPPIFPAGIAMAFELAVYGLLVGLLYRLLPKKIPFVYVTLIASMIGGRVVWGAVRFAIAGFTETTFPFSAFLAGAVTNAIPGIILHIVLIPALVIALRRWKLSVNE